MSIFKKQTARSVEYLDYIRTLGCAICGQQAEPHHAETGGVGMKCSDYKTIPLCRQHHDEIHRIGKLSFQRKYNVDIEFITDRLSGDFHAKSRDEKTYRSL